MTAASALGHISEFPNLRQESRFKWRMAEFSQTQLQSTFNKQEPAEQPDPGLNHAREFVARILEFVASNATSLSRFQLEFDFKLGNAAELSRSPLFMLAVLHTVSKDEELLRGLWTHEHIGRTLIELTQARIVFQIAADLLRPNQQTCGAASVSQQTLMQTRVLSQLSRTR